MSMFQKLAGSTHVFSEVLLLMGINSEARDNLSRVYGSAILETIPKVPFFFFFFFVPFSNSGYQLSQLGASSLAFSRHFGVNSLSYQGPSWARYKSFWVVRQGLASEA